MDYGSAVRIKGARESSNMGASSGKGSKVGKGRLQTNLESCVHTSIKIGGGIAVGTKFRIGELERAKRKVRGARVDTAGEEENRELEASCLQRPAP